MSRRNSEQAGPLPASDAESSGRGDATFILDGMLGSLTRKLRIWGYDSEYRPKLDDPQLVSRAIEDGRTLVTSDRILWSQTRRRGAKSVLVEGETDEERMAEVLHLSGLKPHPASPERSRCSACNGRLEDSGETKLILSAGSSSAEKVYRCVMCGKLFWKGSHWRRLEVFYAEVMKRLAR